VRCDLHRVTVAASATELELVEAEAARVEAFDTILNTVVMELQRTPRSASARTGAGRATPRGVRG